MKCFRWLLLFIFFSNANVFSQEKYTRHTVSKGETIAEIAKKYKVDPKLIYDLNPDTSKGIKEKSVLIIPSATSTKKNTTVVTATQIAVTTHEVVAQETVYGIAKQYNLKVADLYKANPNLEKEGLKKGQMITIPQDVSAKTQLTSIPEKAVNTPKSIVPKKDIVVSSKEHSNSITSELVDYEVLPKETLYAIAKHNGITVADLYKINPNLESEGLKRGQIIKIPKKETEEGITKTTNAIPVKTTVAPVKAEQEPAPKKEITSEVPESISSERTTYQVLPKESLFSIAKKNGITIADLKKANPTLGSSLKVGQTIIIPVKKEVDEKIAVKPTETKIESTAVVSTIVEENKTAENEYARTVLANETKYGIAKEYGISVSELEKQNPSIRKKLIVGSELKIRTKKLMEIPIVKEEVVVKEEEVIKAKPITNSAIADQLIATASENMGVRYRSGGTTKEGYDCSGLMCAIFSAHDIKLPRSSIEMSAYGSKINNEEAQKGDLIFFKTGRGSRINHVGMVVEVVDGEIKFVHAATHGGVMVSSTKESYYANKLVQVNRVLE